MWNRIVKVGLAFSGFLCVSFFQIIWVRKSSYKSLISDKKSMRHEWIHLKQELESLVLGAVIITALAANGVLSWWWMFSVVLTYPIIYVVSWIIQILLPPYDSAYNDIPMEKEARYGSNHRDYIYLRWPFMWITFLFKRVDYKGNLIDKDGNIIE